MSKLHDENKDIRLLSKALIVNVYNKTIEANKSQIIGNRRWGRIDYLCHYCGWTFIWNNKVKVRQTIYDNEDKVSDKSKTKKIIKENKASNKTFTNRK